MTETRDDKDNTTLISDSSQKRSRLGREQLIIRRLTAIWHSSSSEDNLADWVEAMMINDSADDSALFTNISKSKALAKIDSLTDSENFHKWEMSVKWVLDTNSVLNWITYPPLTGDSPRWKFFIRINQIIHLWFLLSMSKDVHQYVL